MKVVVIGTRGFPNVQGGIEKHCEQLYPVLVRNGIDVTVLTRRPYVDVSVTEYLGVKLIPIDCPKQKFLEAIVHSFRAVLCAKKLKPDIVHIHAVGPALVAPLARLLGMKVVFTHHGPDYERKKWNGAAKLVLRAGEAAGCLCANRIITIADNIARSIKLKFGRDAVVIPNGVILPQVLPAGESLKKFGLEGGKYFLAVGRFVPEKGFHDLIKAYARMGNTDWKLVIAGDADHADAYSRSLKDEAGRVPGVVLTGFISGAPLQEIYSNAGIFVLPSYYEGLPIVLLEAMSFGLSCIVSDIPANRAVSLAEERYFKAGDIGAMATKLTAYKDVPWTAGTGEKARQIAHINDAYNWTLIAKETQEVYSNMNGA